MANDPTPAFVATADKCQYRDCENVATYFIKGVLFCEDHHRASPDTARRLTNAAPSAPDASDGAAEPGDVLPADIARLLNDQAFTFARQRLESWKHYKSNTLPLDTVDALEVAFELIDLLLAERANKDEIVLLDDDGEPIMRSELEGLLKAIDSIKDEHNPYKATPQPASDPTPERAAKLTDAQWKALEFLVKVGDKGAWMSNKTGYGHYSNFIHRKSAEALVVAGFASQNKHMPSNVFVTDAGRAALEGGKS